MSQEHSYDAIMQAAPIQQQQERQSFRNAAYLALQQGVELGDELSAELQSPTTYSPAEYEQQIRDATPSSFYEQEMWLNIQPRRRAQPVDTRLQQEIEFENLLVEQHQAEQPREQAEQVQGQNAQIVYSRLEHGWNDPAFDAYLASDDDAYEQVQLSPRLLQLAAEVWGVDEDTAKAYVYHHQLDVNDLALIERSFLGTDPRIRETAMGWNMTKPTPPPTQQRQFDNDDEDLDADDTSDDTDSNVDSNPDSTGGYGDVAALNDVNFIRRTYFSQTSDVEWLNILNDCITEFENLPQQDREAYDNPAGLWALYQRVSYRKQQQQVQRAPQQKTRQRSQMSQQQSFNNAALTPRGFLKQSWIDKLSPDDYAKNADRISAWYIAKKVDRDA